MRKLQYTVAIFAPVHRVWTTMLGEDTYRQWTIGFNEGSYFTGSWETGSEIRFLGPDEDGQLGGLIGRIVENRPDEFVSIEYLGWVENGVDDSESDIAQTFAGMHENYTFHEVDGVTRVDVELDSEEEYAEMFDVEWPKALQRLKELAEQSD